MFEKEAMKDYTDNLEGKLEVNNESRLEEQFEDTFIRGAICAYNKANEWHYVKDELPPEDVPLLCVRGGKIYVTWYYNGIYHDSRCCQVKKPYAWKEIVL